MLTGLLGASMHLALRAMQCMFRFVPDKTVRVTLRLPGMAVKMMD